MRGRGRHAAERSAEAARLALREPVGPGANAIRTRPASAASSPAGAGLEAQHPDQPGRGRHTAGRPGTASGVSIQRPGRGSSRCSAGQKASSRNGSAMPEAEREEHRQRDRRRLRQRIADRGAHERRRARRRDHGRQHRR